MDWLDDGELWRDVAALYGVRDYKDMIKSRCGNLGRRVLDGNLFESGK